MKKHYIIPFFIPHEGCPFTCVFCAQKKISGRASSVPTTQIPCVISKYLKTIPKKNTHREAAFFGGSFTGLPMERQKAYLKVVRPFIEKGAIHGIRISTRPDYINQDILDTLKKYHVRNIELGVQSLSDDVLTRSKRGHTAADVKRSSRLILKNGFTLAHQIMVGLPGSTPAREVRTARLSIGMGAGEVRIYPVAVIKGTELAVMYKKKLYKPLTEPEAIARSARLVEIFKKSGVKILRCGLHPSQGLLGGGDIVSGPFHQAFGQKVETYLYGRMLKKFLNKIKNPGLIRRILFNSLDAASVIGYGRQNAEHAESVVGRRKIFSPSNIVPRGGVMVEYADGRTKMIGRL